MAEMVVNEDGRAVLIVAKDDALRISIAIHEALAGRPVSAAEFLTAAAFVMASFSEHWEDSTHAKFVALFPELAAMARKMQRAERNPLAGMRTEGSA